MSRIEDALSKARQLDERAAAPTLPMPAPAVEPPAGLAELFPIRTNLQFALAGIAHPVVVFCSAVPKEGVTTVVYHLARLLAADKRTLVIDANFPNPRMHELFRTSNGRGLSDLVVEKKTLEECVTATTHPNLDLMTSGPAASAAHWFLGSPAAGEILERCSAGYGIVLIDAPPLRVSPDTAVLGSHADGVVLVVRAGKTSRDVLRYARGLLDNAGARQLGVILNRMKLWVPDFIYRRL